MHCTESGFSIQLSDIRYLCIWVVCFRTGRSQAGYTETPTYLPRILYLGLYVFQMMILSSCSIYKRMLAVERTLQSVLLIEHVTVDQRYRALRPPRSTVPAHPTDRLMARPAWRQPASLSQLWHHMQRATHEQHSDYMRFIEAVLDLMLIFMELKRDY